MGYFNSIQISLAASIARLHLKIKNVLIMPIFSLLMPQKLTTANKIKPKFLDISVTFHSLTPNHLSGLISHHQFDRLRPPLNVVSSPSGHS